jgi:hypothetical protein
MDSSCPSQRIEACICTGSRIPSVYLKIFGLFVWLVAGSWFVLREKYCWLVAGG